MVTKFLGTCSLRLTLLLVFAVSAHADDWPTVHHDGARSGFTRDTVRPPYRLTWVAEFPQEIVTTRVEAIVADDQVFVGTINGTLWALDRETGKVAWRRSCDGPVLHSPAVADATVFCGDAGGTLWAVDSRTGRAHWKYRSGKGGFAASPLVDRGTVWIGSRDGSFVALDTKSGAIKWRFATGGPIRCTAALAGDRVLFASDDMHAYALRATSGELLWKSEKLYGQSFRDYYPVIVGDKAVFRSVLVEEMNDDLNGGTGFLQSRAGIAGGWRELDAFFKSDLSRGTPDLIRDEQQSVLQRLADNPFRRTCFVLDVETGREAVHVPVMYAAGNQGCGLPPTITSDGRAAIFYRTVYSNWSHGVKPAVGVGYLNFQEGSVTPIRHTRGNTPPWNTFWGTCDESTNFSAGGDLLYLCHQGTLSAVDLKTLELFTIHGKRDTWGGLMTPIWAANEWHGPARGSVAISNDQLFWVTGSRVLCLTGNNRAVAAGTQTTAPSASSPAKSVEEKKSREGIKLDASRVVADVSRVVKIPEQETHELRTELNRGVRELLDGWPWAPFYLQMGIGSRDFYFAHPSYAVQALSLAIPHLSPELAARARDRARDELPRCLQRDPLPLAEGRRRELYTVPPHDLSWSYAPRWPVLSHVHAIWLFGERTGDWAAVEQIWPRIQEVWSQYAAAPLAFSPEQGGQLYLNRTAAGCLAYARLARRFDAAADADAATRELERLLTEIAAVYRAKGELADKALRQSTSPGDIHGNQGRKLYFHLNNHKSKLAMFMDLTPEIGRAVAAALPQESADLQRFVDLLMPAYYLAFEERSVHYGENFVDLPDSVHGLFLAHVILWDTPAPRPAGNTDLPWVKADLFHLEKLVHAIEAHGQREASRP